jgi:dynein light intermediate chain 2, cytosolic
LQKSKPQAYSTLEQRLQEKWAEHEDKSKVQLSLVPMVIMATKFDIFANKYESVQKKSICLALRYIAHMNGADLVFSSVREKVPTQLFRALLSHHVFEGGPLGKVEKNQNQPIHVPAG